MIGFMSMIVFLVTIGSSFLGVYLVNTLGSLGMFSFFAGCTFIGYFFITLVTKDTTYAEDVHEEIKIGSMSSSTSDTASQKRMLSFSEK